MKRQAGPSGLVWYVRSTIHVLMRVCLSSRHHLPLGSLFSHEYRDLSVPVGGWSSRWRFDVLMFFFFREGEA